MSARRPFRGRYRSLVFAGSIVVWLGIGPLAGAVPNPGGLGVPGPALAGLGSNPGGSDQGARGVSSFSKPASPQDNAYAESFLARLKDEEVKASDYQSFSEVQTAVQAFIQDYNTVRKHSSLGNTSPCRFEEDFRKKDSNNESVST